jgi:dipeptide/tripeptide permease
MLGADLGQSKERGMKKLQEDLHSNTTTDVKQLGILAALGSLGYVFWIVGGMEMVERLAYYGVRTVAGLYATDASSNGGLGLDGLALGEIFLAWALVQSFVPVFTGGLADRLGYKETIFLSTVIKIVGYLAMAWFANYWGFMVGAVVLAFGTGIFKPAVQGTLVKATNRENSSMAWGVFYQTVNIGGFLGPILAAALRQLEWQYVFYACAGIICLNFLLLLTYTEPGKQERQDHQQRVRNGEVKEDALWLDSLKEISKPVMWVYLLLFSGFWFMFNSFFDILPLHIRDWVDTSTIVTTLFGADGTQNSFFIRLFGMTEDGLVILPEGLVNWNAGMIMLMCFLVAGWSARIKAVNSMVLGTVLASGALMVIGGFHVAWFVAIAILTFSMGEMLSSPKFLEFLGNIAPPQKKAMYLGFSQLSLGIGWSLEGYFGPVLYEHFASKERFSREMLSDQGMPASQVAEIPQGEAFEQLVSFTGQSARELTTLLAEGHNIGMVWYIMGGVGLVSAVGMVLYGRWVAAQASGQDPA